jgi:hypothetical protein
MDKRSAEVGLGVAVVSRVRAKSIPDYGIGPYRAGDVFEVLLAQIGKLGSDLAADLIVGGSRDADAARFGNALKPCRNVDAVAKDVMGLDDHVADIDAHTESNAPVFHVADCKFMNAGLELHGSSDRFDCARKFRQEPVASVLHDVAAVFRNRGLDTVREERCQFGVSSLFVIVHKPRITSHVGGQYRRQSPFDPDWPLLHHGPQSNP